MTEGTFRFDDCRASDTQLRAPTLAPLRQVRALLLLLAAACAAMNAALTAVDVGIASAGVAASIDGGAYAVLALFVATAAALVIGLGREIYRAAKEDARVASSASEERDRLEAASKQGAQSDLPPGVSSPGDQDMVKVVHDTEVASTATTTAGGSNPVASEAPGVGIASHAQSFRGRSRLYQPTDTPGDAANPATPPGTAQRPKRPVSTRTNACGDVPVAAFVVSDFFANDRGTGTGAPRAFAVERESRDFLLPGASNIVPI